MINLQTARALGLDIPATVLAVDVLAAAGRLPLDAVFVDIGAHIGTHTR